MVAHLMPWVRHDEEEQRHIREEAAAITAEQEELTAVIDQQNSYLVPRAKINGFTEGLRRAGFHAKTAEE
jgi:hypothetical protein